MKTVKVGGSYFTQYEASDIHFMSETWKRWLEAHIQSEWRFVRWGFETREGDLSWQMALLCMMPLLYVLVLQIVAVIEA